MTCLPEKTYVGLSVFNKFLRKTEVISLDQLKFSAEEEPEIIEEVEIEELAIDGICGVY